MWQFDNVTVWLCDSLTVWQFDNVTNWQCDSLIMYSVTMCDSLTVWKFYHVTIWPCNVFQHWLLHRTTLTKLYRHAQTLKLNLYKQPRLKHAHQIVTSCNNYHISTRHDRQLLDYVVEKEKSHKKFQFIFILPWWKTFQLPFSLHLYVYFYKVSRATQELS